MSSDSPRPQRGGRHRWPCGPGTDPLAVCWSRLLLAPESPLGIPLPNSTFSYAILLAKLAVVGVLSTKENKDKNTKLHNV